MRRILLATVLAAALLAGCGESTIKAGQTEKTVANFVAKQTDYRPTDVRCPSGVPAKVGETFQCHFTGPEGPYTAYIRILKVEGEKAIDRIVTRPTGHSGSG